ncbi:MAG: hypothetical protein H0U69_04840 [Trueperaceae bacterium]|nr:hypothetical protein [Trueperaceae bacterium]
MSASDYELLERLAEPHCAVCRASAASAYAYLSGVMRDGVNDARTRDEWRRRGGLCRRHWSVWRGLETPALSSAIVARDLLGARLGSERPRDIDCPACTVGAEAERRTVRALGRLSPLRVEEALAHGSGFVCLHHLRSVGERLDSIFRRRLEQILDDLGEFIRKSDYRRAHEPMGDAGDAWLRAIRALGGDV